MAMFVETEEGKAIADALQILGGYCLHNMSIHPSRRPRLTPYDPQVPPEDFVRRAMTHLLEQFRVTMKLERHVMYQMDVGSNAKSAKKGAT